MSIMVKKISLSEQKNSPAADNDIVHKDYLSIISDVTVECTVRIGTLYLTIGELKELKCEQVLHLQQKTNEPLALILNDQIIAKGELMSHEECFALRITDVYKS